MRLQIAVCDTASDAIAARAYWTGKGYTEVMDAIQQEAWDRIGAEEWSGWKVDQNQGASAGVHGPLPTDTGPGFVLLFQK